MDARDLTDDDLRRTPLRTAARELGVSVRALAAEKRRRGIAGKRGAKAQPDRRAEILAELDVSKTLTRTARALGCAR